MGDIPNLADQIPEPPDNTLLVLKFGDEYRVIQRGDTLSREYSDNEDERWFDMSDSDSDPLGWREALKYAEKVYACGSLLASR
ncbi:hypothetical protein IMZ11_02545 [Microtetraspora sp. AC03309]|uniref:hypothetical protein n=1 Tax=Microtetraspora sp. AC03309 TaxID=2779376 RepID=UPI001E444467|nr:hypothetical protein [Microtetraspora sp. AC03309]MCC5574518.1 hypothetical protein [Microtetraspora sp. AC03309]